jgi:thiol-disulfide isomerase/thioredoxin
MKLLITIFVTAFIVMPLFAQSDSIVLNRIFRKTIKKTRKIKTISYDIEKKKVSFGKKDTIASSAHIVLDKQYPDSLLGQRFFLAIEGYEFLYNGEICYRKERKSPIATSLSSDEMDLNFFREHFLDYWLNYKVIPKKIKGEEITSIKYLGIKPINKMDCHVIEITSNDDDIESKETVFICKKNYLPIKCITTFRFNGSSMAQFSEKTISNIKINKTQLSAQTFFKKVNQVISLKKEAPKKLATTSLALNIGDEFPDWNKFNVINKDQKTELPSSDQIILLDFWYMSCYPCLKSIPKIKQLQEEYPNELNIISLNPYDEKRLGLVESFIKRQKITYPVIFPNKEFIENLNVVCYPTFVLMDSKRNIKYISYGVKDNLYDILKERIEELLKD